MLLPWREARICRGLGQLAGNSSPLPVWRGRRRPIMLVDLAELERESDPRPTGERQLRWPAADSRPDPRRRIGVEESGDL